MNLSSQGSGNGQHIPAKTEINVQSTFFIVIIFFTLSSLSARKEALKKEGRERRRWK